MHAPSSSSKHKISTIRAFPRCPCVIFVSEYKMLKFQRHPETHALVTHFGHSAPFRSPYFPPSLKGRFLVTHPGTGDGFQDRRCSTNQPTQSRPGLPLMSSFYRHIMLLQSVSRSIATRSFVRVHGATLHNRVVLVS